MARISVHPKEGGGNNYCVYHAQEHIGGWLKALDNQVMNETPHLGQERR